MNAVKLIPALLLGFALGFLQIQDNQDITDQQRQMIDEILADTAMTRYLMAEMASREAMPIEMMETIMEVRGGAEVANMCQMMMAREEEVRSIIMDQMDPVIPDPPPGY